MNNLFIVKDKGMYFYPLEEKCVCSTRETISCRILKKIYTKLNIAFPAYIINTIVLDWIANSQDVIVVTDSAFSISFVKFLKKKKVNMCLYFQNEITNENCYKMSFFDNIYTYDNVDAKKYGLKFMHYPYSGKVKKNNSTNYLYDVYFIGNAKDREPQILKLYGELKKAGLSVLFKVVGAESKSIKSDKYVNYEENLKYIEQSKCLLDINDVNQHAPSIRYLESIFLEKKLITTQTNIRTYKYFNPENTLVIDSDNYFDQLNDFIAKEYKEVETNFDNIDFHNWIDLFY